MIKVFVVDRGARYSVPFDRFEQAVRYLLRLPPSAQAELVADSSAYEVAA